MRTWPCTISLLLACLAHVHAEISLETLKDDVNHFLATGSGSDDFWDTMEALRFRTPFKMQNPKLDIKLLDEVQGQSRVELTCVLCSEVADTVIGWIEQGDTREQLINKTTALCVSLDIQTERVCRGVIDGYVDIFMWVVTEKNSNGDPVTPNEFCGFALYPDCPLRDPEYEWTLDLDFMGPKPPFIEPQLPPEGSPTIQVLQLTDVHVDPNYLPGGNAECDEPMCCRFDQGEPANQSAAAGYWGDYRDCDPPVHTFLNLLQQAATSHPDVSYVIFTGDVPDHGVWATNRQYNSDLFTFVMSEMRSHFPDVPILPVFGNHEPHPLNVYAAQDWQVPAEVSSDWMYQLAASMWGAWLPGTEDTVLRGGFYSYEVRPGLLVVALNNNVCYHMNWWLIYDSFDPAGQLTWLAETLLAAEAANQKVHIISHLSGAQGSCFAPWLREYRRIVDRFESTIVAQFYGHTHNDHFLLFYALEDGVTPTGVAFSGGSGTPASDVNINYRVYTLEAGGDHRVLDHETWYFNLTEANLAGESVPPNWQKLYSFNDAYGTTSLLPEHVDELVHRMAQDSSLQQQYFEFSVKLGDTSLERGCDVTCLRNKVCDIVNTVPGDSTPCDSLPWPLP